VQQRHHQKRCQNQGLQQRSCHILASCKAALYDCSMLPVLYDRDSTFLSTLWRPRHAAICMPGKFFQHLKSSLQGVMLDQTVVVIQLVGTLLVWCA
jgi:hypothetical protein